MNRQEKNEMLWFKSCGRGLTGEFPQSVLVDTKEMKISTGHQLDEFTTVPLRMMIFKMDAIVRNQLEDRFENVTEKCGSFHCDNCGLCEDIFEEDDDSFISTECWD